jgi:hypothetical protein
MAWWRAHRRLGGGSTAARCCWRSRGGHREGAGLGGEGRGTPERWVDGEAAHTTSGAGVQWRWCCSGARRGPAALVREGEAGVSSNLGVMKLGGCSPERGKTAAALRRSPARRRGSGGGKPARSTPRRWERRRGAQAWTARQMARGVRKIFGRRAAAPF